MAWQSEDGPPVDVETKDGRFLSMRQNHMDAAILAEIFLEVCCVKGLRPLEQSVGHTLRGRNYTTEIHELLSLEIFQRVHRLTRLDVKAHSPYAGCACFDSRKHESVGCSL
jgi:hypothetical protein